jgi:hypothetical protein
MNDYLLRLEDNRLEDFHANMHDELTSEQIQRLNVLSFLPSRREADVANNFESADANIIMAVIGVTTIFTLSFLNSFANGNLGLLVSYPSLQLLGIGVVGLIAAIGMKHYNRYRLNSLRYAREHDNERFRVELHQPIFGRRIQRIEGRMELKSALLTTEYSIVLEKKKFIVTETLWQHLHWMNQRVAAHYLDLEPYGLLLLSIQPADVLNTSPESVVGISDDGEIIYQQDLEDDLPDGEVRLLKKSSDSGQ